MAIVINGSGTLSGLAVGGLPDGTVDAGTLATNSVDSAELIDGAVDDSHIGALTASKLTGALPAISATNLTGIPAANITGTLPAISGANLTGITAGKVLQLHSMRTGSSSFTSSAGAIVLDSLTFASAHTSGNGILIGYPLTTYATTVSGDDAWIYFRVYDGSTELESRGRYYFTTGAIGYANHYACQHFAGVSSNATLTVKITAETNGSSTQSVNSQDNAYGFWIQEIQA
jgi:hypothetical protein